MIKMNNFDDRELWREIRNKEHRVESYQDHKKIKKKLIEHDNEINEKKIKAIEQYNKNLSARLYQMQKETDKIEMQNAIFKQLKVIG